MNTLPEAVEKMARFQVGTELKPEQVSLITRFLNTLTGEYKGVKLTNDNTKE